MFAGRGDGANGGDEIGIPAVGPGQVRGECAGSSESAHDTFRIEAFGVDALNERRQLARRQVAHGHHHVAAAGRHCAAFNCGEFVEHWREFLVP